MTNLPDTNTFVEIEANRSAYDGCTLHCYGDKHAPDCQFPIANRVVIRLRHEYRIAQTRGRQDAVLAALEIVTRIHGRFSA
jgi:hypothetical protein